MCVVKCVKCFDVVLICLVVIGGIRYFVIGEVIDCCYIVGY